MGTKNFTKINIAFECEYCGVQVPPSSKTCRNHCPECLCSKHVDIQPGDRANSCHGKLQAISYDLTAKGLVLIFKCQKCGEVKKNIADQESKHPDNYNHILKLNSHYTLNKS